MRRWQRALAIGLTGGVVLSATILMARYPWFRDLVASSDPTANPLSAMTLTLVGSVWAMCGLVVVIRTGNLVGWIAITVGACFGPVWMGWSTWALTVAGNPPGELSSLAADILDYTWVPAVVLMVVILPLVFPTGRLPARRWVWVVGVAILALVCGTIAVTEARQGWGPHSALQVLSGFFFAGFDRSDPWALYGLTLLTGIGGAGASVIGRLRSAAPVERHQVKWVVSALVIVGAVVVVAFLGSLGGLVRTAAGSAVVFAAYALIPLSMMVAILRYRLFDIDRLVSRTVSYALMVGVSGAAFIGSVFVLRSLLPGTGQIPVAVSTLFVAVLFLPLRIRVMRVIDRRFFRSRYDADLVVERLIGNLRNTFEPEDIVALTRAVIADVFSPDRLGSWIAQGHADLSQSRQETAG